MRFKEHVVQEMQNFSSLQESTAGRMKPPIVPKIDTAALFQSLSKQGAALPTGSSSRTSSQRNQVAGSARGKMTPMSSYSSAISSNYTKDLQKVLQRQNIAKLVSRRDQDMAATPKSFTLQSTPSGPPSLIQMSQKPKKNVKYVSPYRTSKKASHLRSASARDSSLMENKKASPTIKVPAPVMYMASRNLVEIQELSQFSGDSHAQSHLSSREMHQPKARLDNLSIRVPPPDMHHQQLSSTLHSNRSVSSKKEIQTVKGKSGINSSINSAMEVYLAHPHTSARTIASTFDSRHDGGSKRIKRRDMQLSKSGAIQLSSNDSRKMTHSKSMRGKVENTTLSQNLREAARENIQDRKRDKLNDFARHLVMKIESTLQPTKISLKEKKTTPKHSRNSTALSQPYQKQTSGTLEKKTTSKTNNLQTLTSIYTNTHETQKQALQGYSSRGEGNKGMGASLGFQDKSANVTAGTGFSQSQGAKGTGESSTPVSRKTELLFKNGLKMAKKSNRIVQKLIRGHQGRVAKRGTSAKRETGRTENTFESEKEEVPSVNQTLVNSKRSKERKVPILVELSQFSAGKKILLPLSSTSRAKGFSGSGRERVPAPLKHHIGPLTSSHSNYLSTYYERKKRASGGRNSSCGQSKSARVDKTISIPDSSLAQHSRSNTASHNALEKQQSVMEQSDYKRSDLLYSHNKEIQRTTSKQGPISASHLTSSSYSALKKAAQNYNMQQRPMRSHSPVMTFFPSGITQSGLETHSSPKPPLLPPHSSRFGRESYTVHQHSTQGGSRDNSRSSRPQVVAEKITSLKKELHRINRNLKMTIKRIQSGGGSQQQAGPQEVKRSSSRSQNRNASVQGTREGEANERMSGVKPNISPKERKLVLSTIKGVQAGMTGFKKTK